MYSRQQLTADLRALGITPGDVVMVHASVRSVGEIAGGPDEIHLALEEALTTDGTLVEFFRTYPGSRVNHHVARFVVWGRQGDYLLSRQPWNYAFGRDSALDRFVELDGKILLLGCDHDTVTFVHYAEHIVDIPDKRVARFKVPIAEHGVRVWRDMEEFNTAGDGAHANWPDRFFARIVDGYLAGSANHGGRVGDARCHLLRARGLLDFALPVMRRVAADARAADALHARGMPCP